MSPLVRSLLALAALFATAATLPPPPNCKEKPFGQINDYPIHLAPIRLRPPGGTVDIKDFCPPGLKLIGEKVVACNNLGPAGLPPLVYEKYPPGLEYLEVLCVDGCPLGLTVTVTEYCEPAPRQ